MAVSEDHVARKAASPSPAGAEESAASARSGGRYWFGDCPKGSLCAYSGVSGGGSRCSWSGDDGNWAGGGRPCSFSGRVKSLWNNGYAGSLDDVHLVACGGAHRGLHNGEQEAWTNPSQDDPGRGSLCIKSHKWVNM
ncbi:peptidase inhibitor family I36 protein [Nonomuraea dietziae]|uniref:Uncharacterized protein n=1 Tax=Nonomuraea dietziae TaxID=65515 RepID=A0A7W5Y6Z9_9ACTN|nr:peptidase inhibitor family I36 protein [Nonomuraea dietziae]MBB3726723.1 hypothetical protein [Nonomuraea dietziae]